MFSASSDLTGSSGGSRNWTRFPLQLPDRKPSPYCPHLVLPSRHDVRPEDIITRRFHGNLTAAAECAPQDFSELLLVPGVGARTVRALAQVAEIVHGAPYR